MAGESESFSTTVASADEENSKYGFERKEMYQSNLAGTVNPYERHLFLCYKSHESWPSHIENSESDPLPTLLASALKARKKDIKAELVPLLLRSTSKMLALDPTNKLSNNFYISYGDLVIVYERHDGMKAVKVSENGILQNRFGLFKHSDWIGKHFGSKVLSNKGGFVYLLFPTPELWTLVLSHRTQILYIADISFVVMYLEIVPGCVVLESGTGSGSLTTSLARAVAPNGHVYTFDFHEQRAASARADFESNGLSSLVSVGVRDIQSEGFPEEYSGQADSVFLDLPQPWLAIPLAAKVLKQDGVLCSFSPCVEQVQRSCETLRVHFTDIRTFEVLLHTYEVRETSLRSWDENEEVLPAIKSCKKRHRGTNEVENSWPRSIMAKRSGEARGHTGYLTFARLKCIT